MDRIRQILRQRFGHDDFRPGQEALVRALLGGRDALGLLPTGGGKSLTYLLPAALLERPVLVVSPLVALMEDQLRRAREVGLRAEALTGKVPRERVDRTVERMEAGTLDLLLAAPERIAGPFGGRLAAIRIGALVVDEAHCVVQWGYDFRPHYLVLQNLGRRLQVPVLTLTATATPPVRRALIRLLGLEDPVMVIQSFDRPNLSWTCRRVSGPAERWQALWHAVSNEPGSSLVYAGTRGDVERLGSALAARGLHVGIYHAGMSAEDRSNALQAYMAGDTRVVVATNAFGMGVDKADIRQVVHWSPPSSLEAYYQEAGRGGRDGGPGRALLLWSPLDLAGLRTRLAGSAPPVRSVALAACHIRVRGVPQGPGAWNRLARRVGTGGGRDPGEALQRALERLNPRTGESPALDPAPGASGGAGGRPSAPVPLEIRGWRGVWRARREALRRLRWVGRYARCGGRERAVLLQYLGEGHGGGRAA